MDTRFYTWKNPEEGKKTTRPHTGQKDQALIKRRLQRNSLPFTVELKTVVDLCQRARRSPSQVLQSPRLEQGELTENIENESPNREASAHQSHKGSLE